MLGNELIEIWCKTKKIEVKNTTYANYVSKIKKHISPLLENKDIAFIVENNNFFNDFACKKLKKLKAKTVQDLMIMCKNIFDFAYKMNYISKKANIAIPQSNKPNIKLLTAHEQNRLLEYLIDNHSRIGLGIMFMLYSGIRLGELCALRDKDINTMTRTIEINFTIQRIKNVDSNYPHTVLNIGTPKSLKSVRKIPIIEFLIPYFKKYASKQNSYLLTGTQRPLEPRLMQYHFEQLLKQLGISKHSIHSLRHTFATNAVMLGMDVKTLSEILGHSSVNFTLQHYCHSDMAKKQEQINILKT